MRAILADTQVCTYEGLAYIGYDHVAMVGHNDIFITSDIPKKEVENAKFIERPVPRLDDRFMTNIIRGRILFCMPVSLIFGHSKWSFEIGGGAAAKKKAPARAAQEPKATSI